MPQRITPVNQTPRWVWLTILFSSLLLLAGPITANLYRSFTGLDWRDHESYQNGRYLLSLHDVVRQEADPTGAAAVLATLLLWQGEPTAEADVLSVFDSAGGIDTLEDVARQFDAHGFPGQWWEFPAAGLYQRRPPFIVHLNQTGSRLAIVRDARQGYLYLADPLYGNLVMSEEEFTAEWSGQALILEHAPAVPR